MPKNHIFIARAAGAAFALLFIITLVGCATTPRPTPRTAEPVVLKEPEQPAQPVRPDTLSPVAQELEGRGDFQGAAREYYRLAETATAPRKQAYQLRAAEVLLRGNYVEQAERALAAVAEEGLTPSLMLQRRVIRARVLLVKQQPAEALALLENQETMFADDLLRADYLRTRADAYKATGNEANALFDLINVTALVLEPVALRDNQNNLWQLATKQSPDVLQDMHLRATTDLERGWIELAQLYQNASLPTVHMDREITKWRMLHAVHPVSEDLIQSLLTMQSDVTYRPTRIGLLLPNQGPLAKAASAVRDGFFAAYLSRQDETYIPAIRVYDSGELAEQALQAYQRAVADGMEIVIGPLSKESVNLLAAQEALPIPTLALNYTSEPGPVASNLFQFGLAPEDEARQVAERAWLDGYNQTVALVPEGAWGQRILSTFYESWQQFGGTLTEYQTFPADAQDFSAPLRRLLSIDESEQRLQALRSVIGTKPKFDPRRRQDIDFIFVVAPPNQARQIRPQLNFFYAANLPVYATSHVYSGSIDEAADKDMDDVLFCDTPWNLSPTPEAARLWRSVEQYNTDADKFRRLYALGVDSFDIIPQLRRLAGYPFQQYRGQTGLLHITDDNQVRRQLLWARFNKGRPVLLERNYYF